MPDEVSIIQNKWTTWRSEPTQSGGRLLLQSPFYLSQCFYLRTVFIQTHYLKPVLVFEDGIYTDTVPAAGLGLGLGYSVYTVPAAGGGI